MGDDALATIAAMLPVEATQLNHVAGAARLILSQRMAEANATKLDTEHWTGVLKGDGYDHYIEDGDSLAETLRGLVTAEEIEAARPAPKPVTPAWNHAALNELMKRGGLVRECIERFRKSRPRSRILELKEKKQDG